MRGTRRTAILPAVLWLASGCAATPPAHRF